MLGGMRQWKDEDVRRGNTQMGQAFAGQRDLLEGDSAGRYEGKLA